MSRKIQNDRISLEKLLRYILGLAPNEFGLVLGDGGFIGLKELLAAIKDEEGFRGTSEMRILELHNIPGGKSVFEIKEGLIRLKPEYSSLPPPIPSDFKFPKELFVAVKPSAWPYIHKNGLSPRIPKERKVPLFTDKDLAYKVSKRTCPDPTQLRILSGKARDKGVILSPYAPNILLCDFMPSEFILGPTIRETEEKTPGKGPEKTPADFAPTSLMVVREVHKGKRKGKYGDEPDWKVRTRKDRRDRKD